MKENTLQSTLGSIFNIIVIIVQYLREIKALWSISMPTESHDDNNIEVDLLW